MLRVDLIHGGWLKAPNGASSVLRSFKNNQKKFKENGISMRFITLDSENDKFSSSYTTPNKKGKKSYIKNKFISLSRRCSIMSLLSVYFLYIRHCNKIAKIYNKIEDKSEIVFIHDIFTAYSYLKYRKNDNQKMVLILHNNGETWNMLRIAFPSLFNSILSSFFLKKIEKTVLKNCLHIGFVSESSMNKFNSDHRILSDRTFYIYNGIEDIDIKKHNENAFIHEYRLCCVGTLSNRKGQLRLLEAFVKLPDSLQKKMKITLVGDGVLKDDLVRFIDKHKINENIYLTGSLKDVMPVLTNSNIFILPSNDEGLPISIIEAMRCGLPIISTNIAGIPELVKTGFNGLLINPDIDSIYNALLEIPNLNLEELGKNSRSIFQERFTIDDMINSYSKLFKRI